MHAWPTGQGRPHWTVILSPFHPSLSPPPILPPLSPSLPLSPLPPSLSPLPLLPLPLPPSPLQTLSTHNSLNCISTALQILSGQGEVLNLDPRQFYIHLYRIILELGHLGTCPSPCCPSPCCPQHVSVLVVTCPFGCAGPGEVECLLVCLERAFKRRRQVSDTHCNQLLPYKLSLCRYHEVYGRWGIGGD